MMPETAPPPSVQQLLDVVQQVDVDPDQIDTAVTAVVQAREIETAVTHLSPLLLDSQTDTAVRRQIVLAINLMQSPTAVPTLGAALKQDKDPGVRRLCGTALEQIDPVAAIPYLQVAQRDKEQDIRDNTLTALGLAVQQLVATLQSEPEPDQKNQALAALGSIKMEHLNKLLRLDANGGLSIPEATAAALAHLASPPAITLLCRFLSDKQQEQARQEQLTTAELDQIDQAQSLRQEQEKAEERVMISAVTALRQIGTPDVIPCLTDSLKNNLNFRVRRLAASALGRFDDERAVKALADALLNDPDPKVRSVAQRRLADYENWQLKAGKIIELLQNGSHKRPDIEAPDIVTAINPPDDAPQQLTDYLIAQAVDHAQDERLIAILAALVIASANSSMTLAADRIDAYQKKSGVKAEQLQPLRVEVGGSKALTPILGQLEENLKTNFQEPVNRLNQRTSRVWQQTIRIAQIGFGLRAAMSVALFLIGAYLVLDSYQLFKSGTLDQAQFFGPGVSFVAGLGTMLTMVFTGPLKEIRKAVGDVGMASAIFIAYIHRILQISHTFSYYYLERKIDFTELEKAANLIEDTMRDTVEMLQTNDSDGGKGQALLQRLQNPNENNETE